MAPVTVPTATQANYQARSPVTTPRPITVTIGIAVRVLTVSTTISCLVSLSISSSVRLNHNARPADRLRWSPPRAAARTPPIERAKKGTKTLRRIFSRTMSLNATRYRCYLEDARRHADRAANPTEKEAWLKMAERWLRLLALAEPPAQMVTARRPRRGTEYLIRD
jgi:hypothetical protein